MTSTATPAAESVETSDLAYGSKLGNPAVKLSPYTQMRAEHVMCTGAGTEKTAVLELGLGLAGVGVVGVVHGMVDVLCVLFPWCDWGGVRGVCSWFGAENPRGVANPCIKGWIAGELPGDADTFKGVMSRGVWTAGVDTGREIKSREV